jgi:hypothetical protein
VVVRGGQWATFYAMKLPRELGDLSLADALSSYEGDLAPGEHYDGCLFTGTVFTATRADSGRFVECAFCDMALSRVQFSMTLGCGLQELLVPSAAAISWMASASAGLTLCPSSLCASATLLARARTKRR